MCVRNILLLAVLILGYSYWSLAQPTNLIEIRCKLYRDEDISKCKYGIYITTCNKLACWRGPGDECGDGLSNYMVLGQCKSGLRCCNGKCNGCLDGVCHEMCHPPKLHSYQHRSDPYVVDRHMNPLYRFFDYYSNE
uniref:Neuroparsin n=1 Tax=Anopheles epiroticus TaxID=199890 RepID=A0A182PFC1_9DIPT